MTFGGRVASLGSASKAARAQCPPPPRRCSSPEVRSALSSCSQNLPRCSLLSLPVPLRVSLKTRLFPSHFSALSSLPFPGPLLRSQPWDGAPATRVSRPFWSSSPSPSPGTWPLAAGSADAAAHPHGLFLQLLGTWLRTGCRGLFPLHGETVSWSDWLVETAQAGTGPSSVQEACSGADLGYGLPGGLASTGPDARSGHRAAVFCLPHLGLTRPTGSPPTAERSARFFPGARGPREGGWRAHPSVRRGPVSSAPPPGLQALAWLRQDQGPPPARSAPGLCKAQAREARQRRQSPEVRLRGPVLGPASRGQSEVPGVTLWC